jgi:hypothetical protein
VRQPVSRLSSRQAILRCSQQAYRAASQRFSRCHFLRRSQAAPRLRRPLEFRRFSPQPCPLPRHPCSQPRCLVLIHRQSRPTSPQRSQRHCPVRSPLEPPR